MRFITISAAVLIGSALSAASAQQLGSSAEPQRPQPAKPAAVNKAAQTKGTVGAAVTPTTYTGPALLPLVAGGSDSCLTATAIAGAGLFLGDNIGGSHDTIQPSCRLQSNENVWYDWTALASGSTTFSTCPASGLPGAAASFDTVIAAYNGTGCVGTAVACNDDGTGCTGSGFQSTLTFPATSGNIYKLQIMSWSLGATGTYAMAVSAPVPPPANDLCAAATAIAGPGLYPGSNLGAGTDGPAPGALWCGNATSADVWYNWTATFSANTSVSFCAADGGVSALDMVIAAYDSAACAPTTLVACDDDTCASFGPSKITFAATSGNVYKLRIGGWSGASGNWTMSIVAAPPAPANDLCANATPYAGGVVPWTNVGATTDGPAASCGNLQQDVWYVWNATCSGTATFSLCPGGVTPDTVVAVYDGSGCPAGVEIGCDDDTCSAPAFGSSAATFCCTAGQDYLLRIGGFGSVTGSGLFEVVGCGPVPATGTCVVFDDGTTENSIGTGNPAHDILWMHSQGEAGQSTVVKSISTAWGTAAFAPSGPPNGAPARVGIWSDPNGDGDPTDAVMIQEVLTSVVGTDTDVLQTVPLSPPVLVTGKYFIGASAPNGTFPAPLDQNSFDPCGDTAWIVGSTVGLIDYTNLAGEEIPPTPEDAVAAGYYLLRAECKDLEITEMCAVAAPGFCPCGNDGAVGNGCANSVAPGGAHLAGSGNAITNADTVSVIATDVRKGNPVLALFLSGSETLPLPFVSDGMLCGGSNIVKLWTWKTGIPSGPVVTLTGPGANTVPDTSAGIAARSAALGSPILNGETRVYTVLYRDPANFGCVSPATTNYTNGLRILWSEL